MADPGVGLTGCERALPSQLSGGRRLRRLGAAQHFAVAGCVRKCSPLAVTHREGSVLVRRDGSTQTSSRDPTPHRCSESLLKRHSAFGLTRAQRKDDASTIP